MKAVLIVVIVAVLGYLVWERHFSHSARIESAFNACMKELGASTEKARPDPGTPTQKGSDPGTSISKGVGDALTSMLQGMGGAMCGALKDTCTKDFEGQICQTALKRYQ
jgi:hypothetical protein